MRRTRIIATIGAVALLHAMTASAEEYSKLWGKDGAAWDATGRLPDFSFAGYRYGEAPIPDVPQVSNVKDFGARGDGEHDDSQAFLNAIDACENGAIFIPPGRYKITEILEIEKSGVVLRGAGVNETTLFFPKPLNDIRPNMGATTSGKATSNYSWSGGFVWFKGNFGRERLGEVASVAARGSKEFRVGDDAKITAGQWIRIEMRDDSDRSMLEHLYSGDPGNLSKIRPGSHKTHFVCQVVAREGTKVTINRPLRFDIRPEWSPELFAFSPTVQESGIEHLRFEFPPRTYEGHFSELGYNGVAFSGVAHCWARNLILVNCDSGFMGSGDFCSMENIRFTLEDAALQERTNVFGHHGVYLGGNDNLFTDFRFDYRMVHDLSVSRCAGNVFSNGSGLDLCFDHHKRAPYENLFTNIDIGKGTRMWRCGGGADLGRHCAARGTFWNIQAGRPQEHPGDFAPPSLNLIGVRTSQSTETSASGKWIEAIPPGEIAPQNLHEAQRDLKNSRGN